MGTPAIAREILEGLSSHPGIELVAVYTQPDRPAGRGRKIVPSPVKELALSLGLEVRQPLSLKKDEEECQYLARLAPDFLVVAAYGMILPNSVLAIPKFAPVNVHTSLLPAYRGAAPVQRAIMDGLKETAVSIMRIDEELDAGPVYATMPFSTIGETAGSLLAKMGRDCVPLLGQVLEGIANGTCQPKEQAGEASYAAKLTREDGKIRFSRPVATVECHVRGVTPDPGAHCVLKIGESEIAVVLEEAAATDMPCEAPGLVFAKKGQLCISCEDNFLEVGRLKPQGKKSMDAASFVNGLRMAGRELVQIGTVQGEA